MEVAAINPAMDAPQHMTALARANEVRLARAALKRAVGAGTRGVAEVITDCPWEAESMELAELLGSQRRWGRVRSRKLLAELGLNENKPVGSLTARQRMILAARFDERAGDAEGLTNAA